jgi:hypothetical protein
VSGALDKGEIQYGVQDVMRKVTQAGNGIHCWAIGYTGLLICMSLATRKERHAGRLGLEFPLVSINKEEFGTHGSIPLVLAVLIIFNMPLLTFISL